MQNVLEEYFHSNCFFLYIYFFDCSTNEIDVLQGVIFKTDLFAVEEKHNKNS